MAKCFFSARGKHLDWADSFEELLVGRFETPQGNRLCRNNCFDRSARIPRDPLDSCIIVPSARP